MIFYCSLSKNKYKKRILFLVVLPPALWRNRTVESIFGAGVDLWIDASSMPQPFFVEGEGGVNETNSFRA
jgi:hypothetical protein